MPAAGEILLRTTRTLWIEPPLRLRGDDGVVGGVAFCGVVDAAADPARGEGGLELAPGTACLVDPVIPCGRCPQCRGGLASVCPSRMVLGLHGRDGGLAERVAVPATNLLPLAGSDSQRALAPLALPIAAIVQLGRGLGLDAASTVTVLGEAPVSLLAAAVLREGSPRVRIVGDDPLVATIAAKWSLPHRPLAETGRRMDQDAVIVAGGDGGLLGIAAAMLRPRGRLGLLAPPRTPVPPAVLASIVERQQAMLGGGLAAPREGLELLRRGTLDLTPLLAPATPPPSDADGEFAIAAGPGRFGLVEFGAISPRPRSLP